MRSSINILILILVVSKLYSIGIEPFDSLKTAYIASDETIIYEKSSRQSKVLTTLKLLDFVTLQSNTNFILANGQSENWYYVDTGVISSEQMVLTKKGWIYPTFKGWVLEQFLLGKNLFKPVTNIEEIFFNASYVEFSIDYHVYRDGMYKCRLINEKTNKVVKGKIYHYRNILSFDFKNLYYIDTNNAIKSRYAEITILTNKGKFPF